MRDDKVVFLPGQKKHIAESRQAGPFPVGTRVKLAACPDGTPGKVLGTRHGMVRVKWPDLNFIGHHRVAALLLAQAQECPADGPELARDGPQDTR